MLDPRHVNRQMDVYDQTWLNYVPAYCQEPAYYATQDTMLHIGI